MQILLGITGGIAAFKAASVIRLLTEQGHSVKVIPTANALRFIGSATLEALSHNTVDPDLYTDVESVKHVQLGQEAELVIVAPASASFLARYASGVADDLLGNTLLATKAPVLLAPAMHTEMWENPATKANVATLRSRGIFVLEPDSGRLTGSDSGRGRMPEPEAIVATALALKSIHGLLSGKRVLVTAGGTREPIDPVRYIGNQSSGKQGIAIANAATAAGASVTLIACNLEVPISGVAAVIEIETAAQLQVAINEQLAHHDVLIMAAAVADYRVENASAQKLKRADFGDHLELKLISNPDILKSITDYKGVKVGFAAETAGSLSRLASLAEMKLIQKNCDIIVANDVTEGAVFGSDHNQAYILEKTGNSTEVVGTKLEVAQALVHAISKLTR